MSCDKKGYQSNLEARKTMARMNKKKFIPGKRLHAYKCPECGLYHLGSANTEPRKIILGVRKSKRFF